MPSLQVCVEVSEKWEGEKVAKELVEKIKQKVPNPKFILLFATIDYKDEFKKILSGLKTAFPKSPLIGGTVMAFITPENCYARGVTAFALNYSQMDVAVGIGHNTKRNPKKAAKECSKMIENKLKDSKYKNKILLSFISGSEVPEFPGVGRKSIIKSGTLAKTMMSSFKFSQEVLQKGFGRECEVLDELIKNLPTYYLIGGSLVDDKLNENYQFLNENFFTESVVCLGIKTDIDFNLNYANGAVLGDIKFKITKFSEDKQIVHEINNKPAVPEFLKLMNWPENFVDEKRWKRILPYFPVAFNKNNEIFLRPISMMLSNSMGFMSRIETSNVFVTFMSGLRMVNAVNDTLTKKYKPDFGLFSSCAVRLMGLGYKIYDVRKKLLNYFEGKPFLLIYAAGEYVYEPKIGLQYLQESIASSLFKVPK
jgi:hypothetical protein